MTKDDILRMAREAGLHDPMVFYAGYERFAALVAAAERAECVKSASMLTHALVLAEQDRCCGLIFSWAGSDNVAQRTVDAIRGQA
jgi:hypothetical protein